MVKNLFTFFFICLLFLAKQSIANENNPILNIENKLIIEKYFNEINLMGEANYSFLFWDLYDAQLYSESKIFDKNNLRYTNCSDEHGIIEDYNNSLKLNDKIKLIPGHCDPTCNLHDWYVVIDKNGKVKDLWEVSARGFSF